MATCPLYIDKSVRDEFNTIVKSFGGTPLTIQEFSNPLIRKKRTGVNYVAMEIAYYLWDKYEGEISNIKNSSVYNYSGLVSLVILESHDYKSAIKNFNRRINTKDKSGKSIFNMSSLQKKEFMDLFKHTIKKISFGTIRSDTLLPSQLEEITDLLAQDSIALASKSGISLDEAYKETTDLFFGKIISSYRQITKALGIPSPVEVLNEAKEVKHEFNFKQDKEIMNRVFDSLTDYFIHNETKFDGYLVDYIGNIKTLLLEKVYDSIEELKNTELVETIAKGKLELTKNEQSLDEVKEKIAERIFEIQGTLHRRTVKQKYSDDYSNLAKKLREFKLGSGSLSKEDLENIRKDTQKLKMYKAFIRHIEPVYNDIKRINRVAVEKINRYATSTGFQSIEESNSDNLFAYSLSDEINDEEYEDFEHTEEEQTLDYDKSSFEKEIKISASVRRLFFALPSKKKRTILNTRANRYEDPQIAIAVVRSILRNSTGSIDSMIKKLQKHADNYIWIPVLIEKLNNSDQSVREAFASNFRAAYINQFLTMFGLSKGNTTRSVIVRANDSSAVSSLIDKWTNNIINSEICDNGDIVMSKIRPKAKELNELFSKLVPSENENEVQDQINLIKSSILEFLKLFGVEISPEIIKVVPNNNNFNVIIFNKSTRLSNVFKSKNNPIGIITAQFEIWREQSPSPFTRKNINGVDEEILPATIFANDVFSQSKFRMLARHEVSTNPSLMPLSHRIGKKKNYSYTWHSYLTTILDRILSSTQFISNISLSPYRSNSLWLKEIYDKRDNEEDIDELRSIFTVAGVANEAVKKFNAESSDKKKLGQLHESEAELHFLSTIIYGYIDEATGERIIPFNMPITSDKGTFYTITQKPFTDGIELEKRNGVYTVSDVYLDELYERAVVPEIEVMRAYKEEVESGSLSEDDPSVVGGSLFYMIPQLNMIRELFDENGYIIDDDELIKEKALEVLRQDIEDEIAIREKRIKDYNLLRFLDNQLTINSLKTYTNNSITEKNFTREGDEGKMRILATYAVMQSRLGYAHIYTTLLPSQASIYKHKFFKKGINKLKENELNKNKTILQLIRELPLSDFSVGMEALRTDYNKRAAMFIASGRMIESGDSKVKYLFAEDKAIDSMMLEQYKVVIGEKSAEDYSAEGQLSEGTNAQEFITFKEYIRNIYKDGQLSTELYNAIMEFYEKNQDENYKEDYYEDLLEWLENKNVLVEYNNLIINPLKPVYNWIEEDEILGFKPVYIKTSAYPLLPNMKGMEIDKLRIMMEKHGIDRLVFPSGAKLGTTKKLANIWNEDGTINTDISEETINETSKELERIGLRVQLDVPFHGDKNQTTRASQADKNLFTDILYVDGFEYRGNKYKGTELYDKYSDIYTKLYSLERKRLEKEFEVERNSRGNIVSVNSQKILDMLYENALARGLSTIELQALSDIKYSQLLKYMPSSKMFEALMNSIVKNNILKLKFPGNAVVLSTEEGYQKKTIKEIEEGKKSEIISDEEFNRSNDIIYTERWQGSLNPGEFVDKDGKPLKGEELKKALSEGTAVVKTPAQVLIPWRFTINGNEVKMDKFIKKVDGKNILDTTNIDREVLELFGMRIPNSGLNYHSYIEVVGFLPKSYGDLIVAPRDFIAQMGSDFDVDKLYYYGSKIFFTTEGKTIKVLPINMDTLEIYKKELEKVKDYVKNKKKNRVQPPMYEYFVPKNKNDFITVEEVNNNLEIAESDALKAEIKRIHLSILKNANKIVSYRNLVPTTLGDLKRYADEVAEKKAANAKKIISSISEEYHAKARTKANMGKELVGPFAMVAPYIGLYQRTQLTMPLGEAEIGGEFKKVLFNIGGQVSTGDLYFPLTLKSKNTLKKKLVSLKYIGKNGKMITNMKEAEEYIKEYPEVIGEILNIDEIQFRSEVMNELMQAAVDNQKEDVLGNIEVNINNVNVVIGLTMLGYEQDVISRFLRIPAIKKVYEKVYKNSSTLNDNKDFNIFNTALKEVKAEYTTKIKQASGDNVDFASLLFDNKGNYVTTKNLSIEEIDNAIEDTESTNLSLLYTNLSALAVLQYLVEGTNKSISSVISAIKVDSKFIGSTYAEYLSVMDKFINLGKNKEIASKLFKTKSLQLAATINAIKGGEIFYDLFYNPDSNGFAKFYNIIKKMNPDFDGFSISQYDNLKEFFNQFVMTEASLRIYTSKYSQYNENNSGTIFDANVVLDELLGIKKDNKPTHKRNIVEAIHKLKKSELFSNNIFIKHLTVVPYNNERNAVEMIISSEQIDNELIDGLMELYTYDLNIEEIGISGTEFVQNLVIASILQGNYNNFKSVIRFVHPEILEDMGYLEQLEVDNLDIVDNSRTKNSALIQFFQYNPYYAPVLDAKDIKIDKNGSGKIIVDIADEYKLDELFGETDDELDHVVVFRVVDKKGKSSLFVTNKRYSNSTENSDTFEISVVQVDTLPRDNGIYVDPTNAFISRNELAKPKYDYGTNLNYGGAIGMTPGSISYSVDPRSLYEATPYNTRHSGPQFSYENRLQTQPKEVLKEKLDNISASEALTDNDIGNIIKRMAEDTSREAIFETDFDSLYHTLNAIGIKNEYNKFLLESYYKLCFISGTSIYFNNQLKVNGFYNRLSTEIELAPADISSTDMVDKLTTTLSHELTHKVDHLLKVLSIAYEQELYNDPAFANIEMKPVLKEAHEFRNKLSKMYKLYIRIFEEFYGKKTIDRYKDLINTYNTLAWKMRNNSITAEEVEQGKKIAAEIKKIMDKTELTNEQLYTVFDENEFIAETVSRPYVTNWLFAVDANGNENIKNLYKEYIATMESAVESYDNVIKDMNGTPSSYNIDRLFYRMTEIGVKFESLLNDSAFEETFIQAITMQYMDLYANSSIEFSEKIPTPDEIRKKFNELTKDGKPKLLAVDTDGSSKNYLIMQKRAIRINQGQPWYKARVVKTTGEGVLRSKEFYTIALEKRKNVTLADINSIDKELIEKKKRFCS